MASTEDETERRAASTEDGTERAASSEVPMQRRLVRSISDYVGHNRDKATQCNDRAIRMATGQKSVSKLSFAQEQDWSQFWKDTVAERGEDSGLWAALIFALKLVAYTAGFCFVSTPDVITQLVPHGRSLLSMGILYVFFQTIALLGGFMLVQASIMSTSAVQFVDECDVMGSWEAGEWNQCLAGWSVCRIVGRVYAHFAALRMCWLLGRLLFEIGWELYGDFPRLRLALDPRHHTAPPHLTSPADLASGGERGGEFGRGAEARVRATRRAVARLQQTTLLAPLLVLTALALLAALAPVLPEAEWVARVRGHLVDGESRVSRAIRVTLTIALMQWAQQFISFFPRWYHALPLLPGAAPLVLVFSALGPLSALRLLQWAAFPRESGAGWVGWGELGGSSARAEGVLLVGWCLLFLFAARAIVLNRAVRLAGWNKDAILDPDTWTVLALRFKLFALLPPLLHFLHGFLHPARGFTFAQNDLIVLTFGYPLFLAAVYVVGYCSMVLRQWQLLAGLPLISAGAVVAVRGVAGSGAPGLVLAVWLHLGALGVQAAAPADLWHSFSTAPLHPADIPRYGSRSAFGAGRKMAVKVSKVFLVGGVAFTATMSCLGVLALLQKETRWFPQASFISLHHGGEGGAGGGAEGSGAVTRVRHAIAQLDLHAQGHPAPGLARYAVCGVRLWGLEAVDYALLSLVAYFEPPEVQPALHAFFPPVHSHPAPFHVPAVLAKEAAGERGEEGGRCGGEGVFWTEVRVPGRNVTVVAVRGTEFWRLSDYLEDVRMWTEPVMFSLLSTILPTIAAWSPQARAIATDTLHSLLEGVGLPDLEYKYMRLLRYIQTSVVPRVGAEGVVLTGHSLGGGMAHIVGAILNLPVVAFSPPGSYQSLSKHLYWNAREKRRMHTAAHNRTVSFLVEEDLIGRIFDTHGGLVQTITCSAEGLIGPIGCHMLESTICNLIRHCGHDPRWRNCQTSYDPELLLEGLRQHLQESYRKGELVVLLMLAATVAAGFAASRAVTYILKTL